MKIRYFEDGGGGNGGGGGGDGDGSSSRESLVGVLLS